MTFPCTRCGACCRNVAAVSTLKHLALKNGACRHLNTDNLCQIYEKRPKDCRIDLGKPPGIRQEEWHAQNLAACQKLLQLPSSSRYAEASLTPAGVTLSG